MQKQDILITKVNVQFKLKWSLSFHPLYTTLIFFQFSGTSQATNPLNAFPGCAFCSSLSDNTGISSRSGMTTSDGNSKNEITNKQEEPAKTPDRTEKPSAKTTEEPEEFCHMTKGKP